MPYKQTLILYESWMNERCHEKRYSNIHDDSGTLLGKPEKLPLILETVLRVGIHNLSTSAIRIIA